MIIRVTGGRRVNCHEHQDLVAVAACACGRGLCGDCQAKRQPPTCDTCHAAAVTDLIARTQLRLVVNAIVGVAYLWLMLMKYVGVPGTGIILIPILAWGFFGFRWLLDGFLGATRLEIFASAQSWWIAYFVGSVACALAGFIIVPIQIVMQRNLLKRLKADAA
ncbi:hypothetical protein [Acidisoma sp. C75]